MNMYFYNLYMMFVIEIILLQKDNIWEILIDN